ncbi:MAG TPA: DUF58 domain-containing protein [Flavobacteriaceae bacterium]|nr:DUF58 domain-containing protein [Flavobacteriaceae bacterium]
MVIRFFKALYLSTRFFYVIFSLSLVFFLSFWWNSLYAVAWVLVFVFILFVSGDIIALFSGRGVKGKRKLPDKFSNSDENLVAIYIENYFSFPVQLEIIDEIPEQFQKRDFLKKLKMKARGKSDFRYYLKPVERGEYVFGKLNLYVSTKIGLAKRRFAFQDQQMVKVYPSFIQMKKYDFLAIDNRVAEIGLKKIRRIGHTMEFEQIKDYVRGDDIRTINWKASAKSDKLMVNQYQDEKSQPVYSIINTGRVMKMPFEGLKLLDYAINSTLAFSNIALKKNDKVGMLTYSHKIENFLPANNRKTYLNNILETLYNVDTDFLDSDLGLLYAHLRRKVSQRSLVMLYTNFEHFNALKRQLPYFKAIAKKHLLVVIFFENTELKELIEREAENISEIYDQTIATEFEQDKKKMLLELQKHGIQAILTPPENLTIHTINKYLELKSRGLL